jgi:Glucose-6-phosphate dehydrogenase subunit
MPATSDAVWSAQDTTPDAIEAALRELLIARHAENGGYVPARVLNMIVFVDRAWSGEIANRLRGVGRYHASRLVVFSYEPSRERLDARASVASEGEPSPGELSPLRETVVVEIGDRHLDDLLTIADPLLVSDLLTLLWSPHGHADVIGELLPLAQAILLDSVDEPVARDALSRARALSREAYVVDLAWLRSTPWRERLATVFDPVEMRRELRTLTALSIRHHPDSAVAAMLFVGWLASRLDWELSPLVARDGALVGKARAGRRGVSPGFGRNEDASQRRVSPGFGPQDIALRLAASPEQQVRGLAGLELETASGLRLQLDRGRGGLHARREDARGEAREWTILGASRGEAGVLGEGIRQALLRDPTYAPALAAAERIVP